MKLAEKLLKELNDVLFEVKGDSIQLADDIMEFHQKEVSSEWTDRIAGMFFASYPMHKNNAKKAQKLYEQLRAIGTFGIPLARRFSDLETELYNDLHHFSKNKQLMLKHISTSELERVEWDTFKAKVIYEIDFNVWISNQLKSHTFQILLDMTFKISMKRDKVILSKIDVSIVKNAFSDKLDKGKLDKFFNSAFIRNLPPKKEFEPRNFRDFSSISFDTDVAKNNR